jgi:hypothetical protein
MAKSKAKGKMSKFIFEDTVVTVAVAIGILGGGIMSLFAKVPPIIVSIFLGMGISSLVYRFLGGINQDNSITLKGIKLTGTVAVLIGCALIINTELARQLKPAKSESKNLILEVREGDFLSRDIEVRIENEDEFIEPVKNKDGELKEGKFSIPLEKIQLEPKIFISQNRGSEEEGAQNSEIIHKIEYIHGTDPILKVHL